MKDRLPNRAVTARCGVARSSRKQRDARSCRSRVRRALVRMNGTLDEAFSTVYPDKGRLMTQLNDCVQDSLNAQKKVKTTRALIGAALPVE